MNTIKSFQITNSDEQTLELPKGTNILEVGMKDGVPVLYCAVDTSIEETRKARVFVYAEGDNIPWYAEETAYFKGTFQTPNGTYFVYTNTY
jgi:hypothetical protein